MTRCPVCDAEVPAGAQYCPTCGAALPRAAKATEQPPLPFSPWTVPGLTPHPAGATAIPNTPDTGKPLTGRQVAIAAGSILLFLFIIMLMSGRWSRNTGPTHTAGTGNLPVLGMIGQPVNVGKTMLGVAFTGTPERMNDVTAKRGKLFAVGVIVGNSGQAAIALADGSLGLLDEKSGEQYQPVMTAWGMPKELQAGRYTRRYSLPPREAIAGLLVFDVPVSLAEPRLLVRDLTTSNARYTGVIDLTREARRE